VGRASRTRCQEIEGTNIIEKQNQKREGEAKKKIGEKGSIAKIKGSCLISAEKTKKISGFERF